VRFVVKRGHFTRKVTLSKVPPQAMIAILKDPAIFLVLLAENVDSKVIT